jgi:predicted dehydrogenase
VTGWGILATGTIAAKFASDLALIPEATMVAVGSRRLDTAEAFAEKHGIPRAYGSWADLAADPAVDVIYVATPHSAHHAASVVCLSAGKAVLCEKPFTLDVATSLDLITMARARGLFLMEAMWMRCNPTILHAQSLVASGLIGDVTHVTGDFGVQGPFAPSHRLRDPLLGGGALLDLGVYPVTLAHLFLGAPSSIQAWASLWPEGTDSNTSVTLGYDSGAVATLHCGGLGETAQRATVTGTVGRIEIDPPFWRTNGLTVVVGGQATRVDLPMRGVGLGYQAEEVMRCLRLGLTESPVIPHEATLDVMRTLDAVRTQIGVTYP